MRLIGRLPLIHGQIARSGYSHGACDDQHFGKAAGILRGKNDAADPRIDRQLRQLASQRGKRALNVDGAELLQQLIAVGDRTRTRRLRERKRSDVAQIERRHAQYHRRKRRTQMNCMTH